MKTILTNIMRFILVVQLSSSVWADGLVVIVSPQNPIQKITKKDTKRIFLGMLRNFETGDKILLANLAEGSPLREEFYQRVTGDSANKAKAK